MRTRTLTLAATVTNVGTWRQGALQQPAFRERQAGAVAHDKVVKYPDVQQRERIAQAAGDQLVRLARLGDAGRVIVGKDHGRRIVGERLPHDLARMNARDVDACALAERMGSYVAPWGVAYVAWLAAPTVERLGLETASPAGVRVAPRRPRGESVGFGLRAGDWVVAVDGEGAYASSPNALTTKLVSGGDSALLVGRGERLVVALVRSCPSPISPAHDLPSTR